jgi:hypothetical protein
METTARTDEFDVWWGIVVGVKITHTLFRLNLPDKNIWSVCNQRVYSMRVCILNENETSRLFKGNQIKK